MLRVPGAGHVSKATRVHEGVEDDQNECERGHQLGVDYRRGTANEPTSPHVNELRAVQLHGIDHGTTTIPTVPTRPQSDASSSSDARVLGTSRIYVAINRGVAPTSARGSTPARTSISSPVATPMTPVTIPARGVLVLSPR